MRRASAASRWARRAPTPSSCSRLGAGTSTTRGARELERWVEAGGRLVVDAALITGSDAFEQWSGIEREREEPEDSRIEDLFEAPEIIEPCQTLEEISYEREAAIARTPSFYEGCSFDYASWLGRASRGIVWLLSSDGRHSGRARARRSRAP